MTDIRFLPCIFIDHSLSINSTSKGCGCSDSNYEGLPAASPLISRNGLTEGSFKVSLGENLHVILLLIVASLSCSIITMTCTFFLFSPIFHISFTFAAITPIVLLLTIVFIIHSTFGLIIAGFLSWIKSINSNTEVIIENRTLS